MEARGATEATRRSAEMEMRQSSLVSQTNLLAKENQILREQVSGLDCLMCAIRS